MCAQELAPSRSGLQWMLRKFKFKIKQKKRQEYCLKKIQEVILLEKRRESELASTRALAAGPGPSGSPSLLH